MTNDELKARLQAMIDTFVQEERAAVVAWLREVAATMSHNGGKCCSLVDRLATEIERGEHRREGEP